MTGSEMVGLLPTLTATELLQIRAASDYLLQGAETDRHKPEVQLYRAMAHVCESHVSFESFKGTSAYRHWRRHSPTVLGFATEHFPWFKSVNAHYALLCRLMGLLAADLQGKGLPLTPRVMTSNLGRMPAVFDDAFPGYIRSGLTHLVFRQKKVS